MLTRKQKEIFVYICDFLDKNGISPSLEEIKSHFNLASPSTAEYHVKNLCSKGYLRQTKGKARSLEILKPASDMMLRGLFQTVAKTVPIFGYANAGTAVDVAEELIEGHVEIPKALETINNLFALFVDGDSMNRASIDGRYIEDGSIVFIDPNQKKPETGSIVLSVIDNHANIKVISYTENGFVKLSPHSTNSTHKPILLSSSDNFFVNGKVVGVA